jgi:hypothetical protein
LPLLRQQVFVCLPDAAFLCRKTKNMSKLNFKNILPPFLVMLALLNIGTVASSQTWTQIQPESNFWQASALSSDGGIILAAHSSGSGHFGGLLKRSTDGGVSWINIGPTPTENKNWQNVAMSANGLFIMAAENNGRIYKSADGGVNWTETQPAGNINGDWRIAMSDDGQSVMASNWGGRLYKSTDYGVSWSELQPAGNSAKSWCIVAVSGDGNTFLAGIWSTYNVYVSHNAGINWTTSPSYANQTLWWSADFSYDGQTAYMITLNNVNPLKSTDGLLTWNTINVGNTSTNLAGISCSSDGQTLAIISMWENFIYYSLNGGSSWNNHSIAVSTPVTYEGSGVSVSQNGSIILGLTKDIEEDWSNWPPPPAIPHGCIYKCIIPAPAPIITSFTPASAGPGTTVTITGTNFTGATAVSFGGMAAASFAVNSATEITAVLAAGASGSVSVTTPGGTASLAGFTYISDISWTGTTSTAWNTAGNWSANSVPTVSDNVSIPDVTNAPVVATGVGASCNNLTLNSGASLTIQSGGSLITNGTLTNSAGNEGLVINSGGSLIQNTAAVAATVKRAITGDDKFHLFISPINESVSASSSSCFNGAYVDRYQESAGEWVRLATGDNVVSTYGYSVNFANGSPELVFPGTLKTSPVSYTNLSYTASAPGYGSGWNLVGNPYPCGINTALLSVPTGINATAYVWDETGSGNYIPLTIGAASATPGIIAALQGFFVRSTSATNSLILANAAKVHGGTFHKSSNTVPQMLTLSIVGNGYSDKTYVRFREEATEDFDQALDAYKLSGLDAAPQLYSILPAEKAAINTLPTSGNRQDVPLGLKVGETTTYTLNVEGISSFNPNAPVFLDDLKTGSSLDLQKQTTYTFTASPSDSENRFKLMFASTAGVSDESSDLMQVYAENGTIYVSCNQTISGTAYLYSVSGQLLTKAALNAGKATLQSPATGVYLVRVVTGASASTRKIAVVK